MSNLKHILLLITVAVIFIGCSSGTPEEKIMDHLEETIVLEEAFEAEQQKINELELKDHELYEEIVSLSLDEFEEIVTLADEAIELLDQRLEHLDIEKESIEASKDEFEKVEKQIEKLEDDKQKNAQAMYDVMMARFASYDQVYEEYNKSIGLTKDLYEQLKNEEIEEKDVVSLITKVNETYESVFKANDDFNDKTEQYNDLKQAFYASLDEEVAEKED